MNSLCMQYKVDFPVKKPKEVMKSFHNVDEGLVESWKMTV